MKMIGIVGYGIVGKALHNSVFPDAIIYDKFIPEYNREEIKDKINGLELCFVCVNTPSSSDGSCDLSAIEDAVSWIDSDYICIKSAVVPGTTDRLIKKTGKKICVSPEYIGETKFHDHKFDMKNPGFVVVGGDIDACKCTIRAFQSIMGPMAEYYTLSAVESEIVKYMENSFFAVKVIFCNIFNDICGILGADYNKVRESWLADKRINRSHTIVTEERGYSSKCLLKDIPAIIKRMEIEGYNIDLLRSVVKYNEELRK